MASGLECGGCGVELNVNDVLDMGKATSSGVIGVGTWYVEISQLLQLSISTACLCYLVAKIYFLVKNNGKQ